MILITPSWVPLDKRHILANTNQGGGYSPARNLKKNMNEELKDEEIILDGQVKESLIMRFMKTMPGASTCLFLRRM